jgi:nucleotide-binding universal stress UspA family protein
MTRDTTTKRRQRTPRHVREDGRSESPIIAGIDASPASRAAIETAVELADDLESPLVFVYVRRGPAGFLGAPFYQRRLTREMRRARSVLEHAISAAHAQGVPAEGEILEGSTRTRIREFARDRGARLVVVGSRGRRLRPSIARAVARTADLRVVVSGRDTALGRLGSRAAPLRTAG